MRSNYYEYNNSIEVSFYKDEIDREFLTIIIDALDAKARETLGADDIDMTIKILKRLKELKEQIEQQDAKEDKTDE